jgi:glycosyltransferase involved in cell wall biosynthesis
MDWKRQCCAVVPCFNEAAHIGAVITGVQKHLPTVIVVDDGSTDATAKKAKEAGAEVVCRSTNCGKGAALRAGWQHAFRLGFAWALTLDGDGQHAPENIPTLLNRAATTGAALVVGNRMGQAELMPWLRRGVNRWMSRRLSKFVGLPLPDSQCGFRLVNLDAWSRLQLEADRFEVESETLVAFIAAGRKVEFAPVQAIYKSNPSKIHPVVDGWRWFRWWFRQRNTSRPGQNANASRPFASATPPG